MTIRDKSDLISGVCLAGLGIYVACAASQLAYSSEYGPGPGFLPLWLGVGLFVLALCLLLHGLFGLPEQQGQAPWTGTGRALAGWLGLMAAIVLLPWLGFSLSFAFLTAFLVFFLERRSPVAAVGVALALALGFHLIFTMALGLDLPPGPWGF